MNNKPMWRFYSCCWLALVAVVCITLSILDLRYQTFNQYHALAYVAPAFHYAVVLLFCDLVKWSTTVAATQPPASGPAPDNPCPPPSPDAMNPTQKIQCLFIALFLLFTLPLTLPGDRMMMTAYAILAGLILPAIFFPVSVFLLWVLRDRETALRYLRYYTGIISYRELKSWKREYCERKRHGAAPSNLAGPESASRLTPRQIDLLILQNGSLLLFLAIWAFNWLLSS